MRQQRLSRADRLAVRAAHAAMASGEPQGSHPARVERTNVDISDEVMRVFGHLDLARPTYLLREREAGRFEPAVT